MRTSWSGKWVIGAVVGVACWGFCGDDRFSVASNVGGGFDIWSTSVGGGLTQFGDSLNGLINIFGDDGVPFSKYSIYQV